MVKEKSQISIEYLILTGFVLLVIIVPAIFFLYSFANKGIHGTVQTQKASDLGNGLVDNAKQIYYLGLYSKKKVEYDVPLNVENMFIVEIDDKGVKYYYFGMFINDKGSLVRKYFQSDVPLTSDATPPYDAYVDTVDNSALIQECTPPNSCSFFNFKDFAIKEGKKTFKLETVMEDNDVKVAIVPIID